MFVSIAWQRMAAHGMAWQRISLQIARSGCLFAYFKLLHLFRVRRGIAPKYLMNNFKAVSEAHSHNTRSSSHDYFVSRDLSLSPSSFAYTSIKVWNSLPLSLKNVDKFDRFKRNLKEYFSEGYIE